MEIKSELNSINDVTQVLDKLLINETNSSATTKGVVFQFVGQGVLKVGIASELFKSNEVFRSTLERCDKYVKSVKQYGVIELLYPSGSTTDAESKLHETQYAQPILVSIECSMADMWRSKGIHPEAVLGR